MSVIDPTRSLIRGVQIKGANLTGYTNTIRIFESVCKPYITGQLIMIDNNNVMENMGLVAGEAVELAFQAPPNEDVYSFSGKILALKGQPNPENLKSQIYTVDVIGETYYKDRGALVQKGYNQGITATQACRNVHQEYLGAQLNCPVESRGPIGFKDGYTITNEKPFTAIYNMMRTMLFDRYKTGNVLFFRDRNDYNLVPLEHLMSNLSRAEHFVQKETWGANFFDKDVYRAIIFAESLVDRNNAGRSGGAETAAAANQSKTTFDFHTAKLKIKDTAKLQSGSFGSGINSIASLMQSIPFVGGSLGGLPNIQIFRDILWPDATAPHNKTMEERLYSAEARGGPQLRWNVPLQTGINVTVGKGADVALVPPTGDLFSTSPIKNSMSGSYLVTDLVHELIHKGNAEITGTTTMQGIKGGYSQ